jgi:Arc/MetJ-type ribon-helix-helix transcriptional regulator
MDREITIRVSDEVARLIDEQVAAGAFGSAREAVETDVVDAYVAPWLTDDALMKLVAEADADPTELSGDDVREAMLELHREQIAKHQR